jgi:signal transduction histidine kinase
VKARLVAWYGRQMQRGVDDSTPVHLVDRVVYGNWVYLLATIANVAMAAANLGKGYWLLLGLNGVYQGTMVAAMALTARHHYLAARLLFLLVVYAGFAFSAAIQGTATHIEHYFLALAVLAFGMFHPSERRYSVAFAITAAVAYLVFAHHPEPWLAIDPARGRYGSDDRWANEVCFTVLLVCSLIGIANAYGRATRLVDEQRAKLFEDSRLSALGAMACNVAHEINTPLMAMDLHLDELDGSLAEDPARAGDREVVTKLGELSRRIATIVRGFKLVSHGGADDGPADTTIGAVIGAAVDLAAGRTKPLAVAVSIAVPAPDVALRCRVVGVSQIVLNLIGNAVDALAALPLPERWIRIEAAVVGARVVVAVSDAGRIADPAVRRRLFEAFYTTKPLGKGTGLGLSLSRQTAERHGGRLWFDEAAPTTRFVLELPVAAAADEPVKAAA